MFDLSRGKKEKTSLPVRTTIENMLRVRPDDDGSIKSYTLKRSFEYGYAGMPRNKEKTIGATIGERRKVSRSNVIDRLFRSRAVYDGSHVPRMIIVRSIFDDAIPNETAIILRPVYNIIISILYDENSSPPATRDQYIPLGPTKRVVRGFIFPYRT